MLISLLVLLASAPEAEAAEARTSTAGESDDAGLSAFERGDFDAALRSLEESLRRAPADRDLKLLLGISYYRLGRTGDAEPLLEAASTSDDPETAATARVFLGLIAHDRGEVDEARSLLAPIARSDHAELSAGALTVLDAVAPRTWTVGALLRSEYDSNVPLAPQAPLPSTTTPPSNTVVQKADAAFLGLVNGVFRPFSEIGLSISDTASFRKHIQLTSYDLFANTANARWDYLGQHDRIGLGYAFDVATLGGPLYFWGDVLEGAYRRAIAQDLGLGARYGLRQRHYSLDAYTGYTGWTHSGAIEVSYGTPEQRFELNLAAIGYRELTADSTLTATALGMRAYVRDSIGPVFGLFSVSGLERRFDEIPTGGTEKRRDSQVIGELTLGFTLSAELAIVAGSSYVRNLSNATDFDYLKWTAHLGVEYSTP
jgi:hypothetical protein